MRLLLIRHGESEADLLDVHEGRADFPLTDRGKRQAEAMAAQVTKHYTINRIWCSTLQRAFQTASALSAATGIALTPDERLMEFNNGLIAGLERSVVREKYPEIKVPIHRAVYEQESMLEFRFRADFMLNEILAEAEPTDTVAVVTHGGMINQLLRSLLRLPVDCNFFFSTADTGIHDILIDEKGTRIVSMNRCDHIAGI